MVLVLAVLLVTLGIIHLEGKTGASLVVQWIRICLPVQETRVQSLIWKDSTWLGATEPMGHNY